MKRFASLLSLAAAAVVATAGALPAAEYSHQPLRSIPAPSKRPLPKSQTYFISANAGDDEHTGSEAAPWRTLGHGLEMAKAGDTLVLRGGTYFENVTVSTVGKADAPLTIRCYPGEQAVLDGGIRNFVDGQQDAWEPVKGGGPDEYRSVKTFPNLRDVMGLFGDSHIGLHTYHNLIDLQATSQRWDGPPKDGKSDEDVKPVYCGPGLFYDKQTGRIHVRLSNTQIPDVDNYRGPSDPRKAPLVVAPFRSVPLRFDGARFVRVQDLVIRGGGYNTILIGQTQDLELDNVTVFCGTYGIRATGAQRMKLVNSGIYGSVPPWTFRAEESLRSYPGRPYRDITRFGTHAIIVPDGGREFDVFYYPANDEWEIAHCDFGCAHDGLYLGGIECKFHHNRVAGTHDDGIYLSPMSVRPGIMKKANLYIYENYFNDCLTALAYGGVDMTSDTVYIYRNLFDMRKDVATGRPATGEEHSRFSPGKIIGDHGSPPWSTSNIYHNTFVMSSGARSSEMALLSASAVERPKTLLNNVLLHLDKLPALKSGAVEVKASSDGNLYWSPSVTEAIANAFFKKYRASSDFESSKSVYPDGFDGHSLVADPKFIKVSTDGRDDNDYRLQPGSPAIDAGVAVPAEWPDSLRDSDKGQPDIGALPLGAKPIVFGRLSE